MRNKNVLSTLILGCLFAGNNLDAGRRPVKKSTQLPDEESALPSHVPRHVSIRQVLASGPKDLSGLETENKSCQEPYKKFKEETEILLSKNNDLSSLKGGDCPLANWVLSTEKKETQPKN